MINTSKWNRIRYTLYAPVYDWATRFTINSRKLSIESLNLLGNEKILIVGAGTGLDLDFIPDTCTVVATDITPAMVNKIKDRSDRLSKNVEALVMDGQQLSFNDQSFDVVILHLILAVIPNPNQCILECERVLKVNGQIAIYDKFLKVGGEASIFRRLLNGVTAFLATDITRSFESILANTSLNVTTDIPADFGGNFRRILVKKPTV